MRLELTRVGLLVELANHYTTRGASSSKDGPGCHDNEELLYVPQSAKNETLLSDSLMSYSRHSLGGLTSLQPTRSLELKPHHQILFSFIRRTPLFWESLILL